VDDFFLQLRSRLERRPGKALNLPGVTLREAAVLVPLFIRGGVPYVLLTKRPTTLRKHAGQIAFPGGSRDPEDPTPVHTALRETHEEVGIPPERVEVLGMLDEFPTITSYRVTPYVGVIPPNLAYVPSADEIDEILEVPLPHLLNPAHQRIEIWEAGKASHEVYFYDFGPHVIWGVSGHILKHLFELISGIPLLAQLTPP
jgi:8-oxo-dGTP pyrophosphatase MutT (NUDIX family)